MQNETCAPIVSICCITYNHEQYIAQALRGFLMQETNFPYEIIIGEDCSTDKTRNIIIEFSLRYPGKIKLLTDSKNVGSIKNQIRTFETAKGKYIAMCDGDDYWTDPLKLQKQVDFMERQPDCVICCHYSRVIDENGELVYENPAPVKLEFAYEDVLLGRKDETRICSLMIKNKREINQISMQEWFHHTFGADTFLKLFALSTGNEKIHVLPEVMAVYRLHRAGVYSLIDPKVRKRRIINDFNILIQNFHYSENQKKALRNIYISQHLLFEIKSLKIQRAVKTLINLA